LPVFRAVFRTIPGTALRLLPQQINYLFDDPLQRGWCEHTDLSRDQAVVRRKKLAGASIADPLHRTAGEVTRNQFYGSRVRLWVAGNLTQDVVTSSRVGQNNGRAQLGLREIGERELDEDYCSC
jgi:hypothetical protein